MSDEESVRTLLRESDIPPTRLNVEGLMSDSRRSRRRRRLAAVGAAVVTVVAVTAVAVPIIVDRQQVDREPTADFATTTRVVHRPAEVEGAADCTATPLRRVDGDDPGIYPGVFDADPSGERIVGSGLGGKAVTLWTRGEPTRITLPDLDTAVTATAVNASGTVIGFSHGSPLVSFRYRDGDLRFLTAPDRYPRVVAMEINDRGDVLGYAAGAVGLEMGLALVVWPADHPDQPRVVADTGTSVDPESAAGTTVPPIALHPLALGDDGTVIALHVRPGAPLGEATPTVVVYRPDGTQMRIDGPAGVTGGSFPVAGVLRGDHLFLTSYDPTTVTSVNQLIAPRPVRWNLRTGLVEIFDGFMTGSSIVGNSAGWFVTTEGLGATPVLIAPNGQARSLPAAKAVTWVSPDGSTLAGITADDTAVTWRCRPWR